jgi:hypothetical protein
MLGLGLVLATFVFNSCNDDEGYSLDKAWYSIATVHPLDDSKSYWLSLDSGTSLWPVATNIPWYYPKEKQRAIVVYTLLSDAFQGYDHAVKILDLKSILTKSVAENLVDDNDSVYGTDPVELSEMWIGDGYLNIVFEFNYGGNLVHYINLIESDNEDTPYSFEFRHNAYNDEPRYRRKGIVAFDLSSVDTNGKEVELTILVNTFEGDKAYTIKYDSSKNQLRITNYELRNQDYGLEITNQEIK